MKAFAIISSCIVFLTLCLVIVLGSISLYGLAADNAHQRREIERLTNNSKTFDAILEEIKKRCECQGSGGHGRGAVGDNYGDIRISPIPEPTLSR